MRMNLGTARFTQKRQVPKAEHVERRKQRSEKTNEPEGFASRTVLKRGVENGVFRKESCKGEKAGYGQDGCGHGPECDGHLLAQTAHLAQILLAAKAVDDGASSQEEQCLEEGMRHEVEDCRGISGDTAAQKHVAELRDGGVGEDAPDVVLDQRNCCS